tara:strand:+ start:147 stop:278 length:132 start_codon:yes stop_codon:yes gene_type:complete
VNPPENAGESTPSALNKYAWNRTFELIIFIAFSKKLKRPIKKE